MIIFDIETVKNPEMEKFVEQTEAPSNYKDEKKIAEYIKAKTEEKKDKMALDLDFCTIRAMAWNIGTECIEPEIHVINTIEEEIKALEDFWNASEGKYLCGYNIIGFDLPIIIRRSWVLPIMNYRKISISRYNAEIIDLMYRLYYDQIKDFKKLDKVCDIYGINNLMPGYDGSMVKDMDDKTIKHYCLNDLRMTCQLAKKMQGVYI